jgi:hypothetical protein
VRTVREKNKEQSKIEFSLYSSKIYTTTEITVISRSFNFWNLKIIHGTLLL